MIKYLKSLFSSKGDASIKRVIVVWLMFDFTFYIFSKTPEFNIATAILGAITLILGVQAITKT